MQTFGRIRSPAAGWGRRIIVDKPRARHETAGKIGVNGQVRVDRVAQADPSGKCIMRGIAAAPYCIECRDIDPVITRTEEGGPTAHQDLIVQVDPFLVHILAAGVGLNRRLNRRRRYVADTSVVGIIRGFSVVETRHQPVIHTSRGKPGL